MRKNIDTLINVSKMTGYDASLPFVFTTTNGQRQIVWFNFTGNINYDICNITVSKIFILSGNNSIETLDVNINLQVVVSDMDLPEMSRKDYIEKFNEQFDTNQFDDVFELLSMAENKSLIDMYEAVTDYLKKPRKMVCKHCGSDIGFFTKLSGVQYYTADGEDDGYEVDTQNSSVYCRACKKRVCSFEEFKKEASHGY
jgi:rubrerythrin